MTDKESEVKRFVAPNMSRALELVREEMGPEAIILSSQKVKGGVEIVTSIERDLSTRGVEERRSFGQNFDTELDHAMESDISWQSQAGIEQAASNYSAKLELNGPDEKPKRNVGEGLALEIERARERMLAAKRQAAGDEQYSSDRQSHTPLHGRHDADDRYTSSQHNASNMGSSSGRGSDAPNQITRNALADRENEQRLDSMRGEIADLRMMLEQQMWQRPAASGTPTQVVEPIAKTSSVLSDHLSRLGLTAGIATSLQGATKPNMRVSDAWKQSLAKLARSIPIADAQTERGGVFAFIGPTGVGKTTTLAKLAAQYTIANGPGKVALVSMDTHRVGAVEQLRALGRILEAPVRTVVGGASLMTTLSDLKDFPLVLIDTAGFRHGDPLLHTQLAQLDQNPSVKRLLVLSSLSQLQTLKASIHGYRPRKGVDACVLSKLDEASSLGEALSAVIQHQLSVAYITDGQQIPSDAHAATAHKLVATAVSLAKQHASDESASL